LKVGFSLDEQDFMLLMGQDERTHHYWCCLCDPCFVLWLRKIVAARTKNGTQEDLNTHKKILWEI